MFVVQVNVMGDVTDPPEENMVKDGLKSNQIKSRLNTITTILTLEFRVAILLTVKVDAPHSGGGEKRTLVVGRTAHLVPQVLQGEYFPGSPDEVAN